MSIEAYQAVWSIKRPGFTTNLRCTLLTLAEHASKYNGYTCVASVATIAEMLDTKPRQAQRNLNDLEALGLIKVTPNRGRGNTNLYDLAPIMALKPVTDDIKPVIHDTFSPPENTSPMTPINEEKVSSKTEKVSSRTLKGVIHDTQTVLNHINQKEEEESDGDDPIMVIKKHFIQTTGILPTRSNVAEDWEMPIQLWLNADEVDVIKDKINRAWLVALDKKLRISSPRSLNNTMVNLRNDGVQSKLNDFTQTWQTLKSFMASHGADRKPALSPEVDALVRKAGGWYQLCMMNQTEAQNRLRSFCNGA